jgi:uncharacterized protein YyaL (SSP411 family)
MTAIDQPVVVMRPRSDQDDAQPAGAALAVLGWAAVGQLTDDVNMLDRARTAVDAIRADLSAQPSAHATWLRAHRALDRPGPRVILGGPSETTRDWASQLHRWVGLDVITVPQGLSGLPAALQAASDADAATAWPCSGQACRAPVQDLEALLATLDGLR